MVHAAELVVEDPAGGAGVGVAATLAALQGAVATHTSDLADHAALLDAHKALIDTQQQTIRQQADSITTLQTDRDAQVLAVVVVCGGPGG